MKIKTAYIEITNRCNLNCVTCYNRSGLNKVTKELSLKQIEDTINLFLPYGLERFLFSGGEPTLHSEFDKILDLIDKYPQLTFGIVTNGTNPNKKLIEYLNSKANFKLQISLDGSSEETNSKTRGKGNFAKTVDFAKQITTPSIKPLLKMVISQNNFYDVESFCNLALSLNFTPELAFIYKSGNGTDGWSNKELSSMQKMSVLKFTQRFNKEKSVDIFLPMCTTKCPLGTTLDELSLCIKTDGSIQPCQSLYSEKFTIGNILSFDANLFLNNLNRISALARQRYEKDFGCKKCIIKDICGGGCMAEAVNLYDDYLSDDGNCSFRKQQFIHLNLKGELHLLEKE